MSSTLNILKRIFFDEHRHWDCFVAKYKNKLRSNVLKEVEKFRGCGDLSSGFGKGTYPRTRRIQVNHRHVVFTIYEGLWEIFLLHREKLLKDFMDKAVCVVKTYLRRSIR